MPGEGSPRIAVLRVPIDGYEWAVPAPRASGPHELGQLLPLKQLLLLLRPPLLNCRRHRRHTGAGQSPSRFAAGARAAS